MIMNDIEGRPGSQAVGIVHAAPWILYVIEYASGRETCRYSLGDLEALHTGSAHSSGTVGLDAHPARGAWARRGLAVA